jgi:hypothetical protein
MIKWIRRIKEVFNVSNRIAVLESELLELDAKLKNSVIEHSKQFEKKIKDMTFAYTNNLNDTKSDYLKRYLEVRMDCMQQTLTNLSSQLPDLKSDIYRIEQQIEEKEML